MEIIRNIIIQNPETKPFLADIYYPEEEGICPLVIFVHGYKGYKDWGAWDLMARKIAEAGFAFVKFNFSHNGTTLESPSEFGDLEAFGNNNFSKEISDYDTVINHFVKDKKIDTEKIAIMGHSRGGGISVIKAFEDDRVKTLITLAGVSHFGYRFPSGDRLEHWEKTGVMHTENTRTQQQMPHYFQFYQDYKANEERFSVQHAAQHLEIPYLIVQGTNDEAIKEKEAFLLNEWAKNSELYLIENANHVFGAKEPWTQEQMPPDLHTAAEKIIEFLKANLN